MPLEELFESPADELERLRHERDVLLEVCRFTHDHLTRVCGVTAWPVVDKLYEAMREVEAENEELDP